MTFSGKVDLQIQVKYQFSNLCSKGAHRVGNVFEKRNIHTLWNQGPRQLTSISEYTIKWIFVIFKISENKAHTRAF